MTGRRFISVLLILFIFSGLYAVYGISYHGQPGDRALAVRLFEEGKFSEALPHFSRLCYDFPYDFMVKYFFGACLVETGQFGLEAEKNLVLASSADVPAKVSYYLGKLYHAKGNWNNAQRFYNRFKNNAEVSEITDFRVDDLINLCYDEVNPFVPALAETKKESADHTVKKDQVPDSIMSVDHETDSVKKAIAGELKQKPDTAFAVSDQPEPQDTLAAANPILEEVKALSHQQKESEKVKSSETPVLEPPVLPPFINFQINDRVIYLVEEMFRIPEAKNEFRIATDKENQLDSLLAEVQQLRKQYHLNVNPVIRDSLAIKIQNLEYRNLILNTEVDQHYFKSRKLEQEWWDKAGFPQLEEFLEWKDSLIALSGIQYFSPLVPDTLQAMVQDSIITEEIADTVKLVPSTDPEELVYKIQIGAYNRGIPSQRKLQFDKLSKIRTIDTLSLDNGLTVYTTGNLTNFGDALKLQSQIRIEGIKDAFVIAVKNGKRVTLPEVKQP